MRSGVIAQKVGMTRVYTEAGEHVPVTVLRVDNCQVVAQRTDDKDGYSAVQLGVGTRKAKNMSRAERGHFARAEVEPKRKLAEFRVSPENLIDIGEEITADHYFAGQYVDVAGTSIGKGFAGTIKRHNFKRGPVSHGSHNVRAPGSIGASATPSRVFKGQKMSGRMGGVRVTQLGLVVHQVDVERNLLLVKGSVPGPKSGIVEIRSTD